jgi:hypothetical protein
MPEVMKCWFYSSVGRLIALSKTVGDWRDARPTQPHRVRQVFQSSYRLWISFSSSNSVVSLLYQEKDHQKSKKQK